MGDKMEEIKYKYEIVVTKYNLGECRFKSNNLKETKQRANRIFKSEKVMVQVVDIRYEPIKILYENGR